MTSSELNKVQKGCLPPLTNILFNLQEIEVPVKQKKYENLYK